MSLSVRLLSLIIEMIFHSNNVCVKYFTKPLIPYHSLSNNVYMKYVYCEKNKYHISHV